VTQSGDDTENMSEDIEIIDEEGDGKDEKSHGLQEQIEELKKERLYLLADFDNFRKQAIKERSDLVKYGSEPIIREFLTVLDNLERAASTPVTADSVESYKNGIEMIVSQFKKVLEKFGVEEVQALGQSCDPLLHEAVSSVENPDAPPNTVTDVLQRAFKLKGKVIRPAQVVVNTLKSKKEDSTDDSSKE
jgi:molecular chaperone GrpE